MQCIDQPALCHVQVLQDCEENPVVEKGAEPAAVSQVWFNKTQLNTFEIKLVIM